MTHDHEVMSHTNCAITTLWKFNGRIEFSTFIR